MRFRRDAPVMLIGAAIIVVVLTAVVSNRLFSGLTERVEQSQFDSMEAILAFNLQSAEKKALARAELIAGLPAAQRLLASRDREGLSAEYVPVFEVQRDKHGVDQMQFHVAPATSFLRLHAPATHSDDLSGFRPMVVSVNQDHIASAGTEIAFNGPAIFGVAPVQDEAGAEIGTFEVGISFGPILDNLKVAYDMEFALFIEEELLNPDGVPKEVFGDQNRLGKYVKYHSTHWDLMQQLVDAADLARLEEPVRYARDAYDVPYGVLLVPLRGSTGTPVGVIAVGKSFDASRAAAGQSLVWQSLLALFAVVTLAGAVQVVVRGFLVRPVEAIAGRFKLLADGEPAPPPVEDPEMLCTELQQLATQYERLRQRAEQQPPAKDEEGSS